MRSWKGQQKLISQTSSISAHPYSGINIQSSIKAIAYSEIIKVEVCVNFMMVMAKTRDADRICIVSMGLIHLFQNDTENID